MNSAQDYLNIAGKHMESRASTYDMVGGQERSMEATVRAFNIITRRESTPRALDESEGWLLMQLLKDVRQWSSPVFHKDSAEDCVAYAALKAEALDRGQELTPVQVDRREHVERILTRKP